MSSDYSVCGYITLCLHRPFPLPSLFILPSLLLIGVPDARSLQAGTDRRNCSLAAAITVLPLTYGPSVASLPS